MGECTYFVYLLASKKNGTLYCGVTSDLLGRAWQHREGVVRGFTTKYGVKRLVWFEPYGEVHEAISREKRIKQWPRQWKINLIEANNPEWRELYFQLSP